MNEFTHHYMLTIEVIAENGQKVNGNMVIQAPGPLTRTGIEEAKALYCQGLPMVALPEKAVVYAAIPIAG